MDEQRYFVCYVSPHVGYNIIGRTPSGWFYTVRQDVSLDEAQILVAAYNARPSGHMQPKPNDEDDL